MKPVGAARSKSREPNATTPRNSKRSVPKLAASGPFQLRDAPCCSRRGRVTSNLVLSGQLRETQEARAPVSIGILETTKAPSNGAFHRDRDRTGDVQLGKLRSG